MSKAKGDPGARLWEQEQTAGSIRLRTECKWLSEFRGLRLLPENNVNNSDPCRSFLPALARGSAGAHVKQEWNTQRLIYRGTRCNATERQDGGPQRRWRLGVSQLSSLDTQGAWGPLHSLFSALPPTPCTLGPTGGGGRGVSEPQGVSPPEEAGVVQRPEWSQGGHWAPDLARPSALTLRISLGPLRWHATWFCLQGRRFKI